MEEKRRVKIKTANKKATQQPQVTTKKVEISFLGWDPALEDLLRTPVSPDLTPKKVKWRPASAITPRALEMKRVKSRDGERSQLTTANPRGRGNSLNSREVMIHNMITAPLSPRKQQKIPGQQRLVRFHDQHTIERVYHQRAQKIALTRGSHQKSDQRTIARGFSIPISHGVTGPTPFRWA